MMTNEIRMKLIALLDKHGDSYASCKGCSICTEIEQLRKQLDCDPAEKYHYILDKGQDMTKNDITFLIDKGVLREDIRRALKINDNVFREMLRNFGLNKRKNKKGVEKAVTKPLPITIDEFIQLFYVDKKSRDEICQMKEIKPAALSNWKWTHKVEIQKAATEKGVSISEHRARKEKGSDPNRNLKKQLDEKDKEISALKQEIETLHAACEDVENENANAPVDDPANHPNYYHKGNIDVIKIMELYFPVEQVKGFHRGNILKYILRYQEKGGVDDLRKAKNYLSHLIKLEETNSD